MRLRILRRSLSTLNVFLGIATLTLAFSFLTAVRPATARVTDRPPGAVDEELAAIEAEYLQRRRAGLVWQPHAPVSERELKRVILREDFAQNDPPHWIFSGPLFVRGRPAPPEPPGESLASLASLGHVLAVYYDPARESLLIFDFTDTTRNVVLGIGDPLSPTRDPNARFKLTDIRRTGARAFDIVFSERQAPHGHFTLPFGSSIFSPPRWYSEPTVAPASPDADLDEPTTVPAPPRAETEIVQTALRPSMTPHATQARTFEVRFDEAGLQALRRLEAKSMAATIKTAPARDPQTGRSLGLRVTGLTPESPLRAFDVKPGDVLISLNGERVPDRSAAMRILESARANPIVTVVLERRGVERTYLVDANDPHTRRKARGLKLPK